MFQNPIIRNAVDQSRQIIAKVSSYIPVRDDIDPIIILGCGRSGTTILGKSLSVHPDVCYLNEPRHLWISCYPNTDIWSSKANSRGGKIILDASDLDSHRSRCLRRLFSLELKISGKKVIIEKLPINNFRLEFIHGIFPNAQYIHIRRNGLEVARSISILAEKNWFGANNHKWYQLVETAKKSPETAHLPEICKDNYLKGLLEWRLSLQAIEGFFDTHPSIMPSEINYNEFVDNPVQIMESLFPQLNLSYSKEVISYVSKNISRRSKKILWEDLSQEELLIAGKYLAAYQSNLNPLN